MRYSSSQYAAALLAAAKNKSKEKRRHIIRNFIAILRKNRDIQRFTMILREVERQYLRKAGLKKVEVKSAAPLLPEIKKEIFNLAGEKIILRELLKPELLAGITLLIDNELFIDASGRHRIKRLFQH